MASTVDWPDTSKIADPMDQLVAMSRYYGTDPEFVLAGGGNTSVKTEDRLFVKASGTTLADIDAGGFVELERAPLIEFLDTFDAGEEANAREERFKNAVLAARVDTRKGRRPSVEAALHNLLPGRFVAHTHSTWINMVLCSETSETLAQELFGDDVLWLSFTTPGFTLAHTLRDMLDEYTSRTGRPWPDAVVMSNHGVIVCADTLDDLRRQTDALTEAVRNEVGKPSATPFGEISMLDDETGRNLVSTIQPALVDMLDDLDVVAFYASDEVASLVGGADGRTAALGGALSPDQIVYCKSMPVWFEANPADTPEDTVAKLRAEVDAFKTGHGMSPLVVLVKGLGMFAAGDSDKAVNTVRDLYVDAIKVMAGAARLGGIHALGVEHAHFIENWEVEKYRRQIAAAE
jgi:rhamnose utilization protein RhaD (predicted bifunctional aldolase and dehydrogenase)